MVERLSREETIGKLKDHRAKLTKATTKDEVMAILKDAGSDAGYKPAMRALVFDLPEDKWIKW